MSKTLFTITTYNQLEYTERCYHSLKRIEKSSPEVVNNQEIDILVIDDASTDATVEWCTVSGINILKKEKGEGLTHSWNSAYKYFKYNKKYDYFVISNNDVLIPPGAINEMVEVFEKWPFSLVVPLSSIYGAGHNGNIQGIEVHYHGTDEKFVNDPSNYQIVQRDILNVKKDMIARNNLYLLDPIRMKMFNGFFFMMNRNIIKYERKDGNLFDPSFLMWKAEDEFNWSELIPNNDYPALCKTSFVYHFKEKTTKEIKNYGEIANDPNLYFEARKSVGSKK